MVMATRVARPGRAIEPSSARIYLPPVEPVTLEIGNRGTADMPLQSPTFFVGPRQGSCVPFRVVDGSCMLWVAIELVGRFEVHSYRLPKAINPLGANDEMKQNALHCR
jgi:hypothetical protein